MFASIMRSAYVWLAVAAGALLLAGCGEADTGADPAIYTVELSSSQAIEFTDGSMALINECIQANDTSTVSPGAAAGVCLWAFSVPFDGSPPGLKGFINFEWPSVRVTIENKNATILITEICVRIQFDDQRGLENACARVRAAPMETDVAEILLRAELDSLGIDNSYELNLEEFQWAITSARYVALLSPLEQE